MSSLKRIAVTDLKLGMHLHALEGPWLEHPFWRTKFTLTDGADIEALAASTVTACWIDEAKGAAVAPELSAAVSSLAEAGAVPPSPPTPPESGVPSSVSLAEELPRASLLLRRSRQAVKKLFSEARLGHAIDAKGCQTLVDDITRSVFRNPGALVSLSRLKTQDDYTYMHSVAVCALMVALGRELKLDVDFCRQLGMAGLLHDVGKVSVPLEILNKPARLDEVETRLMRTHPERGHALLADARGADAVSLDVCLHHHERMDGKGYPHRLAGDAISLPARMGAVCDVYDAITSNRPYKSGWDPAHAIAQMASWKGQFDPAIFSAFVKSLGIYPVGSLVRLESGRLGIVVEHNPQDLLQPQVRVFFSTKSNMPVPTELVDLALSSATDRIVTRESRERWGFTQLESLWCESLAVAKA